MVGALPPRVATIEDNLDRYFAAARGARWPDGGRTTASLLELLA